MTSAPATHSTTAGHSYRPEIDGLRSFAILPVLLFHFQIAGFEGGFIGVDIFFVISGFLIGGILWSELTRTGRVSLGRFYMRRIKRLAPAYFTVALVSLIIGWVFLLPFDFREFGKELLTATLYLSNIYFFQESGYFGGLAEDKILLHTWSLSVEEQFYIFLPLLLILMASLRRVIPGALIVIAIASLIACIAMTSYSQTAAFYLFPFRAWEMLAGVLLAVYGQNRGWNWSVHPLLSWAGLALIIGGVIWIPSGETFPGALAMIPVLGTVLIIANGQNNNPVNKMMCLSPLVFIGWISYSLYLWHWPVVTFAHYYFGDDQSLTLVAALIALCFALAWVSWKFIETPVRVADLSKLRVFGTAAVASVAAVSVGMALYLTDGIPNRFEPKVRTYIDASADFIQDWSRCITPSDGPFAGLETCPIGPEGEPRVLVWGDSHARAFKEGLELAAFEHDTPALLIWRAGCPTAFGLEKVENSATRAQNEACGAANRQMAQAFAQSDVAFDTVLLLGRWTYYADGSGVGQDVENTISILPAAGDTTKPQAQIVAQALQESVAQIAQDTEAVFVLRQVPEIFDFNSVTLSRQLALGKVEPGPDLVSEHTIPRADVEERNVGADMIMSAVSDIANVTLIDSWPSFCTATECSAMHDGKAGYFDNNHITNSTARRVRDIFDPVFAEVDK